MHKILIVAATAAEISPLLEQAGIIANKAPGVLSSLEMPDVDFLITGAGMVNTAYAMGKYLNAQYALIINAGICGALNKTILIGEVVLVENDTLSEMGAEDDKDFLPYSKLGLGGEVQFHQQLNATYPALNNLRRVKGITVNTVHGNEESIKKVQALFAADTESMEGAAFLYACNGLSNDFIQLRAVSNYVEKRDRLKWNIPLAVKNLNDKLVKIIDEFKK